MKLYSHTLLLLCFSVSVATAEEDVFERPPISDSSSVPQDAVTVLKTKLASGELRLERDEKQIVRGLLGFRLLALPRRDFCERHTWLIGSVSFH